MISSGIAIIIGVIGSLGLINVNVALTVMQVTLIALLASIVRDRLAEKPRGESLGRLTTTLQETSLVIRNLSKPTVFPTQDAPYAELLEYIAQHDVAKAIFLQYSGQACDGVLEAVLKKPGAKAVVYLQDEKRAENLGSKFQATRIVTSVNNMRKWRIKYDGTSEITVHKCTMPMSVRAIMLDDRLLCMGWYTYEREYGHDAEHPTDTVAVSGHDIATVISRKGTDDFDALNSTFTMLVKNYERASQPVPL
jgi:hypothetical protein